MPVKTNIRYAVSFFLVAWLLVWSVSPAVTLVYADEATIEIPTFDEEKMKAKSAYLFNADNGEVLYVSEEDLPLVPASLTKIMTLLIVNDALEAGDISLKDEVTISSDAWQTGGSSMFLEVGTTYTVEELIKGAAIVSGNDASVTLAEHVAGSQEAFIQKMNEKAKSLGMTNTTFETVHGLPSSKGKDTTTAKDLGILAKHYIHTYPDMLKIHSQKEYTTKMFPKGRSSIPPTITQSNSNTLLGSYEGMDGLKTGFADYYNFIGTAKKGEIRLIVVVLGAESNNKRMNTATSLLDFGFSQYKTYETGKAGDTVDTLNVYKAEGIREVEVALKSDVTYGINIRDAERVKVDNQIATYVEGGLKKGAVIGKQVVTLDGEQLAESDIVVTEDLPKTNWFVSIFHQIALLFHLLLNKLSDLV